MPQKTSAAPGNPPPWTPPAARRGGHEEPTADFELETGMVLKNGDFLQKVNMDQYELIYNYCKYELVLIYWTFKMEIWKSSWISPWIVFAAVPPGGGPRSVRFRWFRRLQPDLACSTGSSASAQGARLPRLRPSAAAKTAASASDWRFEGSSLGNVVYLAKKNMK